MPWLHSHPGADVALNLEVSNQQQLALPAPPAADGPGEVAVDNGISATDAASMVSMLIIVRLFGIRAGCSGRCPGRVLESWCTSRWEG